MQLSFDPRDANASASALAIIAALHSPDMLADVLGYAPARPAYEPNRGERPETLAAPEPVVDPAHAFDAPSPAEAFAPVTAAPTAAPAIAAISAPAGTPGNGMAPPTPPLGSDNGPTAATPASLSSGVELDADGLPWDARIHSGPADKRPKNGDGRWRRGRGVDDATFNAVVAELRQVMGAPVPAVPVPPAAAAPTPPAPPVPASPPVPTAAAPIPAPPAPEPTPAPVVMESGPAAAPNAPSATFADLMRKITRMQTAGALTVEQTSQIAQALGLTGVRDLIKRPDLVPSFDALLPDEAA